MISEIHALIENYIVWLRDKTTLRQAPDNWFEITTPFLDRHNDYLQIYVKKNSENEFVLTDDGYVLSDLELSGCKIDSPKRQEILKMTLNGFGIHQNKSTLEAIATIASFSEKKHNLLQSMLAVNDLFYLSHPTVLSLFIEDVIGWLDMKGIRYTPNVKFTGKTGYDHMFDFVIPKSRTHPERIVQAVNKPDRSTAEALAFKWHDTREVRPKDSKAYALLNDEDRSVSSGIIDALKNYDITPVSWSKREDISEELAA